MSYKVESAKHALNKFSDCGDYETVRTLIERALSLDEDEKMLLKLKHINRWSFDKIAETIGYSRTQTRRKYFKALELYFDFYSDLKLSTYGNREIKNEITK